MLSDLARRAREELDVPWDDLRHRRVLVRTLDALRVPAPAPARPWFRIAVGVGMLAAAILVAVLVFAMGPDPERAPREETAQADVPAAPTAGDPELPTPTVQPLLALADGSIVRMSAGARVEIEIESREAVVLRQVTGEVRYEVPRVEGREFTIHAGAFVVLTAVAADFVVVVELDVVTVVVERGRVEIANGDRRLELGANERATLGPPPPSDPTDTRGSVEGERRPAARPDAARVRADVDALLRRADEARRAGRYEDAVAALETILREHGRDRQVPSALFTLGRVERERGRHAAAASAFESCWHRRKHGPLAEDALGSAAVEWSAAGKRERATRLARTYVERFPAGLHAAVMYEIVR